MKALVLPLALFAACLTAAATDEAANKTETTATMRTRLLEDAKAKAAAIAAAQPAPGATAAAQPEKTDKPAAPAAAPEPTPVAATKDAAAAAAKTAQEPPSILPKVEVNQSRITVLDVELQKQDKDIAREKEKTKPTELDKALNNSKVSDALRVLGGESAQYRADLAKERVKIMEDERDILEMMKLAKTKAEKEEMQKQLDELRAYRRDLEKSLR
jgi:hypothetical protein